MVEAENNTHTEEALSGGCFEKDGQKSGLLSLLKIEISVSSKTRVEMCMPIVPEVLQPHGFLHGGATIALLESAASQGARNNADLEKELPFGVDVQIRHRKTGKTGYVHAVAELDRTEGNKWFWSVAAYDDEGDVISDGVVMAKIVSRERLAEKEHEREAARAAKNAQINHF